MGQHWYFSCITENYMDIAQEQTIIIISCNKMYSKISYGEEVKNENTL